MYTHTRHHENHIIYMSYFQLALTNQKYFRVLISVTLAYSVCVRAFVKIKDGFDLICGEGLKL